MKAVLDDLISGLEAVHACEQAAPAGGLHGTNRFAMRLRARAERALSVQMVRMVSPHPRNLAALPIGKKNHNGLGRQRRAARRRALFDCARRSDK